MDRQELINSLIAKAGLNRLPIPVLVASINNVIGILQSRGIKIRDWDDKGKVVQKIKFIGNKVYILAPSENQDPENA